MKLLPALLLFFSLSANAQVNIPWPPNDKVAHFGTSYVITNMMLQKGYSKKQAFWTVVALGTLKEVYDHQYNQDNAEHWNDMSANLLGATSAMLVFKWEIKPKRIWK